jgi:26S proteasome non-ATPase regulatory subunit 10
LGEIIYGGIIHKETISFKGNTTNEKAAKYYEDIIQDIAMNSYKVYTTECIAFLVESMISFEYELKRGDTFIHRMTQFGHIEAVKYMLDCGADPDCRTTLVHPDFPYATLLHVAVAAGSLELVKQLLARGSVIDSKDANENTPLHYAASLGRIEICEFLLARGCTPNIKNKKKMEPLHASILSDDIKTMEVFIRK